LLMRNFFRPLGRRWRVWGLHIGNGAIEFKKSISKPFCYFHNRSRGLGSILSLSTIWSRCTPSALVSGPWSDAWLCYRYP
jgi:hypothetical protein